MDSLPRNMGNTESDDVALMVDANSRKGGSFWWPLMLPPSAVLNSASALRAKDIRFAHLPLRQFPSFFRG